MRTTATALLLTVLAVPAFGQSSHHDYGHVGFPTPGTDELSYPFVTMSRPELRQTPSSDRAQRSRRIRRVVTAAPVRRTVSVRRTEPARNMVSPRRPRFPRLFAWSR